MQQPPAYAYPTDPQLPPSAFSVNPPGLTAPMPPPAGTAGPYSYAQPMPGAAAGGKCHCNGGNCWCEEDCVPCLNEEETDKFCVQCDPDRDDPKALVLEQIKIRKWIRFLATLTLIFGGVEVGVGAYAYALSNRTTWGAALNAGGWFEKGWGGPNWGPVSSVGAWWAGVAAIGAAILQCIATDPIWFIVACAFNAAACCVAIAGASIDGIYSTWTRSLRSCVAWTGTPSYTATQLTQIAANPTRTFPWFPDSGGWQLYGSAAYNVEALMCASNLTSGSAASASNFVGDNNLAVFNTALQRPTAATRPSINDKIFAGPMWWYEVLISASTGLATALGVNAPNGGGKFGAPATSSCFCKWDNTTAVATNPTPTSPANPQVSYAVNFNWDYNAQAASSSYFPAVPTPQVAAAFNAFTNCFQIDVPQSMSCNNVINDGNTIFSVSLAFCCFIGVTTLVSSYYCGMAWQWFHTHEEEVLRKEAINSNYGVGPVKY